MKPKNCKAGQRVIVKENDSGVEVGAKGVILEDFCNLPYVAILEGDYDTGKLSPSFKNPVISLWYWELKKDKDYPDLVDIAEYVDKVE